MSMIRDLMSTSIVEVEPQTPVAQAAAAMIASGVGSARLMEG
jgi:CBS domain-containing protein